MKQDKINYDNLLLWMNLLGTEIQVLNNMISFPVTVLVALALAVLNIYYIVYFKEGSFAYMSVSLLFLFLILVIFIWQLYKTRLSPQSKKMYKLLDLQRKIASLELTDLLEIKREYYDIKNGK